MTAVFEIRSLPYIYHRDDQPADGLARTEWAIERQLQLAADYDEPDLIDVLKAFNPDLDESIANRIEELLDLSREAAEAEESGPAGRWHVAVDEYAAALQQLARLVRGVPLRGRAVNPTLAVALSSGGWLTAAVVIARFGVWPLAKRADDNRADDLLPTDDDQPREWPASDLMQAEARLAALRHRAETVDLAMWELELEPGEIR